MRNTLESEVNKYLNQCKGFIKKEKLTWNEGGELYRVYFENEEKSLFATSLEESQWNLKERFIEIYNFCRKENHDLVKTKDLFIKDDHDAKVSYVFIMLEKITPMINLILDEKYLPIYENNNTKKIKLLQDIISALENVHVVEKEFEYINIFINNEEICVDENGNAKIQLFDMIKNEIEINNYVFELKRFGEQMAKGMGIKPDIEPEKMTADSLREVCSKEIKKAEDEEKKHKIIFEKNMEEAKKINPKAYMNLGYMYEKGRGTPIDYEAALKWYKKAADCKYPPALNNIAHMYQKGYGVKKDYKKAVAYLQKAAKLKDNVAQFNLGMAYQKGKGVERSMDKALHWYKKAAKNGNVTAKAIYGKIIAKQKKNIEK